MSITSTIPGAAQTLLGYMQAVAGANPDLDVQVYTGWPVTSAWSPNFMMLGDYKEGLVVSPDSYRWAAVPGAAKLRFEEYALMGCIRAWSGSPDGTAPFDRLGEAYTLLNGLHDQIVSDIGGDSYVVDSLTSSGSWGDLGVTMDAFGQIDGKGWGVVLGFELHVINAQLIG
jgi:hypothetical protein